ncbi:MAG: hypothetical protein VYA30_15280 [Myxococcota bacterium]|nr:hypothetical protein [Myxococcota bacterium]
MIRSTLVLGLLSLLASGCTQLDLTDVDAQEKESSYHATFIDMTFKGVLLASNTWAPERTIEQQLLYTIGQLNGDRAVGRLDRVEVDSLEITKQGDVYRFDYTVTMPVAWSKNKPIPESYEFVLPLSTVTRDLKDFADTYGETCVSYGAHDVDSGSMWYYYRPNRRRCELNNEDVIRAVATSVPSVLQTNGQYPEYDQVWKDGRLEVVAIFGRADENKPPSDDIGTRNFRVFISKIKEMIPNAIQIPESFEGELGVDVTEMMIEGQIDESRFVSVTILVVDNVRTADRQFRERYKSLTPTADLIIYNGHAGLGQNIRALASRGEWKAEQYVIVFMNGCDTYAYVDDALYAAHREVNPDDEIGTRYVDLVTNAMPAYFFDMTGASMALVDALAKPDEPASYDEIFKNIAREQMVLVTGEEDNVFQP